jgi:hypothetical protein
MTQQRSVEDMDNSSRIADLRDEWEVTRQQANQAYRAYGTLKELHDAAHRALKEALIEAYGPCEGKVIPTERRGEVKLTGYPHLRPDGSLVCPAHDRLKTGKWSINARVIVTLIPAPSKVPA